MTNVPEKIREAWKEVYVLFDTSYNMDGSEQAWIDYWDKANKLIQKYGDDIPLLEITVAVGHMIESFCKQRRHAWETNWEKDIKCLTWGKDEDYPHPRDG